MIIDLDVRSAISTGVTFMHSIAGIPCENIDRIGLLILTVTSETLAMSCLPEVSITAIRRR